jgi:hypothetical protein
MRETLWQPTFDPFNRTLTGSRVRRFFMLWVVKSSAVTVRVGEFGRSIDHSAGAAAAKSSAVS